MKCIIFILFLLSLSKWIFLLKFIGNYPDELVGVVVLYRHGNKAPEKSYPNDPYLDLKYWPLGFGQLLDEGKVNHFKLGQWFRYRYDGLLSESYSPYEILVKSTDVDRTLQSAASNLAGLYYPKNNTRHNIWPVSLPWNPVPIHTVPIQDDEVLAMKKCDNFIYLYIETLQLIFKNISNHHFGIINLIEDKTGLKVTDISFFQSLYTTFYIYQQHNASYLPDWYNDLDLDELSYLAGVSYSSETITNQLQRFRIGLFFNYLQNYFEGIIDGTNQKFLMLSAHDGTISAILNTYGSYDYYPPQFCSTIIWELYKTSEGSYYLKILYKRHTDLDEVEYVRVRECLGDCDYDKYKLFMENGTLDSETWQKECNKN